MAQVGSSAEVHGRIGWRPRSLAKALGVSPHIVYSAVAAGEFGEVWRLGPSSKAIVIPDKAVQEWLNRNQQADVRGIA